MIAKKMSDWLVEVNEHCCALAAKARDAKLKLDEGSKDAAKVVQDYMREDYNRLVKVWKKLDPDMKATGSLGPMSRHIKFGEAHDYDDIAHNDIPETLLAAARLDGAGQAIELGFESLLHPAVVESSLKHFRDGHLRDAVLNAVIAVYDMIRGRTQLDLDGSALAGQAFGLENGKLIFSEVESDSGQNDQKGFLQIFQGVYVGVRNVKAHSLNHDLTEPKAAQYLVMLSLLARRVDECRLREPQ